MSKESDQNLKVKYPHAFGAPPQQGPHYLLPPDIAEEVGELYDQKTKKLVHPGEKLEKPTRSHD